MRSDCEVCGAPITRATRCTNLRCRSCHFRWCGPGGDTGPGHARREPRGPYVPYFNREHGTWVVTTPGLDGGLGGWDPMPDEGTARATARRMNAKHATEREA